jgi:hypothetical protein
LLASISRTSEACRCAGVMVGKHSYHAGPELQNRPLVV